jgi:hypothetical protein
MTVRKTSVLMLGIMASFLLSFLGQKFSLIAPVQAKDSQPDQDQNAALQAVAKMTEGQRTYYQKNGQFRAKVDNIQQDFGITLPPTFDYAVRTTSEAAYNYVIPAQSPLKGQLKAYVGRHFLHQIKILKSLRLFVKIINQEQYDLLILNWFAVLT